jgi:hypothetical protein
MTMLVVSTDAGEIAIQEHELSTITAAELCQLRLSRAAPSVCRKGEVDAGVQPGDRVRPVATHALE